MARFHPARLASSLAALGLIALAARAQEAKSVSPEIRDKLRKATVYIETELFLATRDWGSLPDEAKSRLARRPKEAASGTGFLVSAEGHLITNAHVVDGVMFFVHYDGAGGVRTSAAPPGTRPISIDPSQPTKPFTLSLSPGTIKAVLNSGEENETVQLPKVLKIDRGADLALLKITPKGTLDCLEIDYDAEVQAGLAVLMAGYPGGALPDIAPFANEGNVETLLKRHPRPSFNAGMVTAIREFKGDKRYQLDIRANHGNSGGPITDFEGRVIGVLYAGIDSMQSINYAIPVSMLRKILPSAMKEGAAPAEAGEPAPEKTYDDFVKDGGFSFKKK